MASFVVFVLFSIIAAEAGKASDYTRLDLALNQMRAIQLRDALAVPKVYVFDSHDYFKNFTIKCYQSQSKACLTYVTFNGSVLLYSIPPQLVFTNNNEYNQFSVKPLKADSIGLYV